MPSQDLKTKHAEIVETYKKNIESFDFFQKHVRNFFESSSLVPFVHSIRYRLKDIDHLLEKIERKNLEDAKLDAVIQKGPITAGNVFSRVTDIAGIRVLHLHISQFKNIHDALMSKVDEGEFTLVEAPKAYTWDLDSGTYFESLGLVREVKESYYTSIHYVLRPNSRSPATCEVQVRTLLEEVWGEVDHTMNYPNPTTDQQCKEQIRVLARLVGAGTHLADSIMRRYGRSS
jgi:ppGpp synthetase/RelA/SpoT-type nucleotidyltranferase